MAETVERVADQPGMDLHHYASEQLTGLKYRINRNPSVGIALVLGFQHYLTMIGTTVLIPLLIFRAIGGEAHDLANVVQSALFVSAINTLLQTFLGARLPVVMGNSFYFLPMVLSIVSRDVIVSIPDPHERFKRGMRATQGAFIAGSAVSIILGFSGFWCIVMRYFNPIVIAPVTTMVGLGLFERSFPEVAKCVQIGVPALLLILLFSTYLKPFHYHAPVEDRQGVTSEEDGQDVTSSPLNFLYHWLLKHLHLRGDYYFVFELYPIILGVAIMWIFAVILTVIGAYDHASELGQRNCRTDRLGLVSAAPWLRFPYPFQWGSPTFDDVSGVMAAAFASLIESTGGFYAVSRLAGATPPPPYAIGRGIGWQGIGLLLNGFWGTFTGTTVAPENAGLVGLTRVGSRRTVQVAAGFMLFFSIFGKFGAVFASIPQPIVAAILCITFGMVVGTGISHLQFANINSIRNIFVVGFSLFLGFSVPQYFSEFALRAGHGPVHTNARWFNDILNGFFGARVIVTFIVATVVDVTLTQHTDEDRGMNWTHKFKHYREDPPSYEFYLLPKPLHKLSSLQNKSRMVGS